MAKLNIKVNSKLIFYIILLFPFFKILYLTENYPIFDYIYKIMSIFSLIIILLFILKKGNYSKIINYIIFISMIFFASSIVNHTDLKYCLENMISILGISFIVDYGIRNDTKTFLKSFSIYLSFLVYINFLSILLYDKGMYISNTGYTENWLLGYKNTHILYILPAIVTSFIITYMNKKKFLISNYLLIMISLIYSILVNNSTGIVGILIIIGFLIFKKLYNKKIFNIYTYFFMYIILFYSIIILRIQNIFTFFIVNILHKDITFTGRIFIWDKAIKYIKMKPIIGYGNITFKYNDYIYSAHNTILGLLHKIGIIGFVTYLIMIYNCLKQLWLTKDSYISKFISISIFSYFIMMITETYGLENYIYIFVIAYNIKYVIKGVNSNEKNIAC